MTPEIVPIAYAGGVLRILDQRALPHDERYIETSDPAEVAAAIRTLAVRGAPLIGIAAAYAMALGARRGDDPAATAALLLATRPTAVNLRWAVERMLGAARDATSADAEAARIHDEQRASDVRCGEHGAALIPDGATVLTHCNTGALATGGIGTALGAITTARALGKRIEVLVDETRPLLQGARLTAWELARAGIPHRVIADGAAAGIIARGGVAAVFVGADRIAANGDVANKVGTYGLALAAQAHGVPFYVVAPVSTIDASTPAGASIEIEQRGEDETLSLGGTRVAPHGTRALNPAFDITPAALVSTIVTERGILRPPYDAAIAAATREAVAR